MLQWLLTPVQPCVFYSKLSTLQIECEADFSSLFESLDIYLTAVLG